jgi:hypothetical protein
MPKKQTAGQASWLQNSAISLGRVHFFLVALYMFNIILSDAWNLIARDLVWQRWCMAAVMLIVTTMIWYFARANVKSAGLYRGLILGFVLMDIALASFTIYTERGMASRGVMLYAIPIIVAAITLNRSAIYGTAALSTATYILTATRYFYVYFNEGYKVELYTTLMFYSGGFFILAALCWLVVRTRYDT